MDMEILRSSRSSSDCKMDSPGSGVSSAYAIIEQHCHCVGQREKRLFLTKAELNIRY
jgi:hypothetical protein